MTALSLFAVGLVAGGPIAVPAGALPAGGGPYVAVAQEADGSMRVERLEASSSTELLSQVADLAADGEVLAVAPDRPAAILDTGVTAVASPGDPLRPAQWALDRVSFERSWPATDGTGVVIAVLDTGVDAGHEDLSGAVLPGWDAVVDGPGGTTDPNGHGTHVAGTIAGRPGNGRGGTGAAPGVRILPVRVMSATGSGWVSDVAQGIVWAVDHGADVINMSLGGPSGESIYRSAIGYAREHGVVVVASAGNGALEGNPVMYPGADPDAIAVAAVTPDGGRAPFSSFGSWVDLAAPGTGILAPCPVSGSICPPALPQEPGVPLGYARLSGTSMAAPHVSAAAALLLAAQPGLSPAGVQAGLEASARDIGLPGRDDELGAGLVDPLSAIVRADGPPAPPESVSATQVGSGSVRVSWSAPAGFDVAGFRVYREGSRIGEVGASERSFVDAGCPAGSECGYDVRAVDVVGAEGSPAGPVRIRLVTAPAAASGYWVVGRDGRVAAFGTAPRLGDVAGSRPSAPVVAAAATPTGAGYWLAGADGAVFAFGDAPFLGSMAGRRLNVPIVGMATTSTGRGYWLLAGDGGVFSFGDARFFGSTGGIRLNRPVVDMAATPTGAGYWLVASDGGVFAFGDARFFGSTGGMRLNRPVTSLTPSPGAGYWLVASDGGIFAFGAPFHGSLPGLGDPGIPGGARIRATAGAGGYYILGVDGRVFAFGAALPHGSAPGFDAVDLLLVP